MTVVKHDWNPSEIRELIESRGMTHAELAKLKGASRSTVERFCKFHNIRRPIANYPIEKIRHWVEEGRTYYWIGDQLGVHYATILHLCKAHNIQTPKRFQWNRDQIAEWAAEGKTGKWIAETLGRKASTVHYYCRVNGITLPPQPKGPQSHNWKKGRFESHGYILVYAPDHPYVQNSKRYMFEHRLVMEKHLGRYLRPEEIVHHKNHNTRDNRIENLELFQSTAEHSAHHTNARDYEAKLAYYRTLTPEEFDILLAS